MGKLIPSSARTVAEDYFSRRSGERIGIVKLLFERKEVNPGSSNKDHRTPLVEEAWERRMGIMKLLKFSVYFLFIFHDTTVYSHT